MDINWALLDPIAILVSIYLFVFVVAMLRKKFRLTFFDWLSMNDAFGLRFWSKDWWFLIFLHCWFGSLREYLFLEGVFDAIQWSAVWVEFRNARRYFALSNQSLAFSQNARRLCRHPRSASCNEKSIDVKAKVARTTPVTHPAFITSASAA